MRKVLSTKRESNLANIKSSNPVKDKKLDLENLVQSVKRKAEKPKGTGKRLK